MPVSLINRIRHNVAKQQKAAARDAAAWHAGRVWNQTRKQIKGELPALDPAYRRETCAPTATVEPETRNHGFRLK